MNCDEAFDALTDPSESNQPALKWHLEFCPRCREMQEVLAPALAMFTGDPIGSRESFSSATSRSFELSLETETHFGDFKESDRPRSKPFLTPEAVRVAEQTAKTLRPVRKRRAIRWMMAGAACLLAAVGAFSAIQTSDPPAPPSSSTMLADKCLWTEREVSPPQSNPDQASSRWVVLSCVACHLDDSLD